MRGAEPIRIAFVAERGYVRHAAAMLESLLRSNEHERIVLTLLEGEEPEDEVRRTFRQWAAQRGCALETVRISLDRLDGFRTDYFHRSIWYRVLLPDVLHGCARVLYLDADTLVTAPLRPLWETSLGDALFGAVANPLYPFMSNWPVEKLGLPSAARYPNSGVLLMDLERMREEGFVDGIRRYARDHIHGGCAEQDALAAVYHDRCRLLHPRWNAQTPLFDLAPRMLPWTLSEVAEGRHDPAIVHFTGPAKPTHYLCRHPYRDAYLRCRAATPWPLSGPTGRTPVNFVLRRLPLAWEVRYDRARLALK